MAEFSQDALQEESFLKRLRRGIAGAQARRAQTEGAAKGEAVSRGLAGSSLEAGLRGRAQAQESQEIADIEAGLSQEAAANEEERRRLQEARQYGTSERLGQQAYGTSEREASQLFGAGQAEKGRQFETSERLGRQAYGTGEREAGEKYGTSERLGRQAFAGGEAQKGREFETSERLGRQSYGTSERLGGEAFTGSEAEKQRQAIISENERERKFEDEQALMGAGLGVGARYLASLFGGGGAGGYGGGEGGGEEGPGGRGIGGGGLGSAQGILGGRLGALPGRALGALRGQGGSLLRMQPGGPTVGGYLGGLGLGYAGSRLARATGLYGNEQSRATSRAGKAGTVAGTALGSLFGPIGGAVGGALGGKATVEVTRAAESVGKALKKICFAWDTPIELENDLWTPIANVKLGDRIKGGEVLRVSQGITEDGTLFEYKGILVTGSHAVNEDGIWLRVEHSTLSRPIPGRQKVYSLVTSSHRIYSNGIEFADEFETDDYENLSADASLAALNAQTVKEAQYA